MPGNSFLPTSNHPGLAALGLSEWPTLRISEHRVDVAALARAFGYPKRSYFEVDISIGRKTDEERLLRSPLMQPLTPSIILDITGTPASDRNESCASCESKRAQVADRVFRSYAIANVIGGDK